MIGFFINFNRWNKGYSILYIHISTKYIDIRFRSCIRTDYFFVGGTYRRIGGQSDRPVSGRVVKCLSCFIGNYKLDKGIKHKHLGSDVEARRCWSAWEAQTTAWISWERERFLFQLCVISAEHQPIKFVTWNAINKGSDWSTICSSQT